MEATSSSCSSTELNTIQESLKKVLAGKKLLVVLDDMWRNNYDYWISFLKPFKSSNGGVKILVTTRLDSTADMVKTLPTYHLNGLGIDDSLFSEISEVRDCLKNARTLLDIDFEIWKDSIEEIDPCRLLAQLKHLRVLSFKFFCVVDHDSLLDSIVHLIHLRYLDLSYLSIETLPESMSKLYNLQTLKLNDCERLEKLPSNMQDLVNLLHLDLSHTPIKVLPESLSKLHNLQTLKLSHCERLKKLPSNMQDLVNLHHLEIEGTKIEEMPKGMSKLKDLQILCYYIVGKHEENGIGELGELVNLQGSFCIEKLENVVDSSEAWKARMVDKKYITHLYLMWSSGEDSDIVDSQIKKDVLAKLEPHKDLKELSIWGYRGTMFPDWVGQSSYHNMTVLELRGCRNCWVLPSLGQLPALTTLKIFVLDKVKKIGGSFYKGDGTHQHQETPFRSLKSLEFRRMGWWEEWESYECDDDHAPFPKLEYLSICNCPKLRGDLPTFLPSLKDLSIFDCKNVELPMQHQQHESLTSLTIDNSCDSLTSFALPPFPNLESLTITRRENLTSLEVSQTQPLQYLLISECPKMENIIRLPASLREVDIRKCPLLGEGIERKDPHIWPSISHIPSIYVDGKRIRNDSTS
ncbi:hypothetical protein Ahy_A02g005087 [Arachis hypogaea]|uniref:Uncharacterized protein n=1 Tax=Arachis hypogaea TaxID=3818 RepID=A0A445E5Q0_ARAHY|nr:hypothetical protein Ahy_A02g005087 [Arachis hypogaea]